MINRSMVTVKKLGTLPVKEGRRSQNPSGVLGVVPTYPPCPSYKEAQEMVESIGSERLAKRGTR